MSVKHYGIVYTGSKSRIARDIVGALPQGKRLVDLFGGGAAITDCAITNYSHKWEKFLYNDFDTLLVNFIKRCINGDLPKKPKWVSREEFHELKDKDGYIRYCWSFGCQGETYLYSEENEKLKKSIHNWIVFNEKDEKCEELFPNIVLTERERERVEDLN